MNRLYATVIVSSLWPMTVHSKPFYYSVPLLVLFAETDRQALQAYWQVHTAGPTVSGTDQKQ